jgi:hypothetical protein
MVINLASYSPNRKNQQLAAKAQWLTYQLAVFRWLENGKKHAQSEAAMLPDFGSFYVQTIGTMPVHLVVSGADPTVLTVDNKLFAINFVVEWDEQRMMGTLEYLGTKADALKIAKQLVNTGVYCQAKPELAYITSDTNERVVPFRLYKNPEPLSQEAQDRIQAAQAKRARKAVQRLAKINSEEQ